MSLPFPLFIVHRLLGSLAVVSVLLAAAVTWAQEPPGAGPEADPARRQADRERILLRERLRRLEFESHPAKEPGDDLLDDPLEKEPPPGGLALGHRMTAGEIFNHQAFGARVDDRAVQEHLGRMLDFRWSYVVRTHEFSPMQERKLLLAGQGDIKRFLDQVREQRKEFEAGKADQQNQQTWLMEFDSIRRRYGPGPFGDDSLFVKVLRKIEDDKKRALPASGAGVR
jgi:hypothetical protein